MIFLFCLICWVNIAAAQFPDHWDLKKLGNKIVKGEQYNVLAPTIHVVKDHFANSILRQGQSQDPNEKLLLDENGFQHIWKDEDSEKPALRVKLKEAVNTENKVLVRTTIYCPFLGLITMHSYVDKDFNKPKNQNDETKKV